MGCATIIVLPLLWEWVLNASGMPALLSDHHSNTSLFHTRESSTKLLPLKSSDSISLQRWEYSWWWTSRGPTLNSSFDHWCTHSSIMWMTPHCRRSLSFLNMYMPMLALVTISLVDLSVWWIQYLVSKMEFMILNSSQGFLEISCRDLTFLSLLTLFSI